MYKSYNTFKLIFITLLLEAFRLSSNAIFFSFLCTFSHTSHTVDSCCVFLPSVQIFEVLSCLLALSVYEDLINTF